MGFHALTASLLAATIAMVGCGVGDNTDDTTVGSSEKGQTSSTGLSDHNQADIAFAQRMIEHHDQAISMAQLADTRAGSSRVEDLAGHIKADQEAEVDRLASWLESWSAQVPDGNGGVVAEGGQDMVSTDELVRLGHASGAEFDRLFLELMIEHHEGAVKLARAVIDNGRNDAVDELAGEILRTQEAEIWEMEFLLR